MFRGGNRCQGLLPEEAFKLKTPAARPRIYLRGMFDALQGEKILLSFPGRVELLAAAQPQARSAVGESRCARTQQPSCTGSRRDCEAHVRCIAADLEAEQPLQTLSRICIFGCITDTLCSCSCCLTVAAGPDFRVCRQVQRKRVCMLECSAQATVMCQQVCAACLAPRVSCKTHHRLDQDQTLR